MKNDKPDKPIDEMTESELNDLINNQIENEQKRVDLKRKYVAEFKKVISVKKIVLLYQAERNFVKEVLQQYRDAKDE
jgi:hypothetical protein